MPTTYDRIRIQQFLVDHVATNLQHFCFVLENRLNDQYRYAFLDGSNLRTKCLALVETATLSGQLGDLVFHLVLYWMEDIHGNPHVLVRKGLDEQLNLFRQELGARGDHEQAEQVLKMLTQISPDLIRVEIHTHSDSDTRPAAVSGSGKADASDQQHLRRLLDEKTRRLQVLELQATRFGYNTAPEVVNEIDDIHTEIARLRSLLEG